MENRARRRNVAAFFGLCVDYHFAVLEIYAGAAAVRSFDRQRTGTVLRKETFIDEPFDPGRAILARNAEIRQRAEIVRRHNCRIIPIPGKLKPGIRSV